MDISNPLYGLVLTISSLTIAGIAAFLSYRYFTRKGKTREQAMSLSGAIGGIAELLIVWIGVKGPAIVIIPLALFIIVYAFLYPRALFYLRKKIHGDEVDK